MTEFDLESAITKAYQSHQARINREKEEEEKRQQAAIQKRVEMLQLKLDKALIPAIQESLKMAITPTLHPKVKFSYLGVDFELDHDLEPGNCFWKMIVEDHYVVLHHDELYGRLLVRLGEIREASLRSDQ